MHWDCAVCMVRSVPPGTLPNSCSYFMFQRDKINTQKSLEFLYTNNEKTEREIKDPNYSGTLRSESETQRKTEVPASPRDEALFHCAEPSRVPRGPANSTAFPCKASAVLSRPRRQTQHSKPPDRKSTRLNSSHTLASRMPSSA